MKKFLMTFILGLFICGVANAHYIGVKSWKSSIYLVECKWESHFYYNPIGNVWEAHTNGYAYVNLDYQCATIHTSYWSRGNRVRAYNPPEDEWFWIGTSRKTSSSSRAYVAGCYQRSIVFANCVSSSYIYR